MTTPGSTEGKQMSLGGNEGTKGAPGPSSVTLTRLRGAGVEIDARRVRRVALALCLIALATVAVILFVAGAQKNDQINRLRHDGIRVDITVSGCRGLLGGSGSNAAGYTCSGSFTLAGHRYSESLPGTSFHTPGSHLLGVAVPGDLALVSPLAIEATQHASGGVFILPSVLLALFVLSIGALAWRWRRKAARSPNSGALH
jgi:hypothetical protein